MVQGTVRRRTDRSGEPGFQTWAPGVGRLVGGTCPAGGEAEWISATVLQELREVASTLAPCCDSGIEESVYFWAQSIRLIR